MRPFLFLTLIIPLFAYPNLRSSSDKVSPMEICSTCADSKTAFEWKEFENFRQRFQRRYTTLQELEHRFLVFRENLRFILEHNRDFSQNFTLGINSFSDMTNTEFKEKYVSKMMSSISSSCEKFVSSSDMTSSFPSELDWRTQGAVSDVKTQKNCGSCWSFASIGAMEGAWAIAQGQLQTFSEQELVDCAYGVSYGSFGCNGGQVDGAFKYAIKNGICSETAYPYESGETQEKGTCQPCVEVAHFTQCFDVKSKDQKALKAAVVMQPTAVAVDGSSRYFQFYKSGVVSSDECYSELNHAVLVVGYGIENDQPYWLVKNSWSADWGDEGYIKILRSDSSNDAGICGIALMPSFIWAKI